MRKFILTSSAFEGEVRYAFDFKNRLNAVAISEHITDEQLRWILDHLPNFVEDIEKLRKLKNCKLIEEKVTITFDMFYEKYGYKRDKKKALTCWNRMKEVDRIAAYYYIQTYVTGLKQGVSLKLPVSYLRSEIWND